MRPPQRLLDAIQGEVEKIERRRLAQAAAQVTERYRSADFSDPAVATDAERAAYLAVRFPATYAAIRRVFSEIALRAPGAQVRSLLDLGAGPGTALFAAGEVLPELESATLLEVDERWVRVGRTLAEKSSLAAVRQAQWLIQDLRSGFSCEEHDLAVISYVLGELGPAAGEAVVRKGWRCARQFLAIVEPGTPRGFAIVDAARSALIASGAEILAPCPHKQACPMAAAGDSTPARAKSARSGDPGDWCHFAQRLERTAEHRQLKGGALGYEDEKFSYVIAMRRSATLEGARIVRHPRRHSGHIQLELCTPAGKLESRTVPRSSKEAFRAARKAEWGDLWEEKA
jgi:ribosomal protein RSM22 (predicted rRNA methylase)